MGATRLDAIRVKDCSLRELTTKDFATRRFHDDPGDLERKGWRISRPRMKTPKHTPPLSNFCATCNDDKIKGDHAKNQWASKYLRWGDCAKTTQAEARVSRALKRKRHAENFALPAPLPPLFLPVVSELGSPVPGLKSEMAVSDVPGVPEGQKKAARKKRFKMRKYRKCLRQ